MTTTIRDAFKYFMPFLILICLFFIYIQINRELSDQNIIVLKRTFQLLALLFWIVIMIIVLFTIVQIMKLVEIGKIGMKIKNLNNHVKSAYQKTIKIVVMIMKTINVLI